MNSAGTYASYRDTGRRSPTGGPLANPNQCADAEEGKMSAFSPNRFTPDIQNSASEAFAGIWNRFLSDYRPPAGWEISINGPVVTIRCPDGIESAKRVATDCNVFSKHLMDAYKAFSVRRGPGHIMR
jgi:hypothetical protein